ncbi:M1 family metallopeptidase [Arsenicibacter rosenii]|uniref:Aminopeptidase N n=1 Tax=Arsenicibacter rosenii TaxID=1750698 RepID=A0A1S2VK89_9BACT|nr:M1 family metallopeptidase [Arsenicibacter rosenii]OIN58606.1 peptidase M1 [Arsenicibacter rosenii]
MKIGLTQILVAFAIGVATTAVAGAMPSDTTRKEFFETRNRQYNSSRTLACDLLHTRLDLRFDWAKQYVEGVATLRFKPYFYPQNTLAIDAKGFQIHSIVLLDTLTAYDSLSRKTVRRPVRDSLTYTYPGQKTIQLKLPRTYTRKDTFSIRIVYTAKPNELPGIFTRTNGAITDDKGLYFINPDGKDPRKPRQLWTQGETEANSCWFPTIDSPNEKMTQDIYLTVEKGQRTLSNGRLVSSTPNADGSRTDHWQQTLPHAPYLAMIAVGDFAYVRDTGPRNMEVSYYVEPAYEKEARAIFGRTPAMIGLFEKLFGVLFPWDKYSQIVVRDFVSGAMENTTATVHQEGVHMDRRQLLDGDSDDVIAHELAHHWFGDLVTCESWANLPLNEAFATYAEYLWYENARGRDEADLHLLADLNQYLNEAEQKQEPLIRYGYADREDMFDSHSYQKGGRVLHYLRRMVGDEAFFLALKQYLIRYQYKTVELADLRETFEDVTGQDLNWFFNQWFMAPGHATIKVAQSYVPGYVTLVANQQASGPYTPVYRLPLKVDVWVKGKLTTHDIVMTQARQSFTFPAEQEPDLVIFDADHRMVGTVEQERDLRMTLFQYDRRLAYQERHDAVLRLGDKDKGFFGDISAQHKLVEALNDPFWRVRQSAINQFADYKGPLREEVVRLLRDKAQHDKKPAVRAEALLTLHSIDAKANLPLLKAALADSSCLVASVALENYLEQQPADAAKVAARFEQSANGEILTAVAEYYATKADPARYDWYVSNLKQLKPQEAYNFIQVFGKYLLRSSVDLQRKALPLLENVARFEKPWFVRFGAYQALGLLLDVDGVEGLRQDIRNKEEDPQLKSLYEKF